jgi:lipopolysaccharide transport system ATP-binding protein
VVRLCDKVLWLDHGTAQGFGDAREMCRRYRIAQSKLMAQEDGGFRAGGELKPIAPVPQAAAPRDFAFDPDAPGPVHGGGQIAKVNLLDPDGEVMGVAAGGEDIELRLTAVAEGAIAGPVIAFVLRDRLGQVLFGDETQSVYGAAAPRIASGQAFDTRFRFRLPHLASGAYAIEIFLYDGDTLLAHAQDAAFLHLQSRHISTGLANLAMRAVTLERATP